MQQERRSVPKDVMVLSSPGLRGLRFTTEWDEQRIREEKDQRDAKQKIRCSRRNNLAENSHLDTEIKKLDSVVRLRDSLLQDLASHENISKGFSPGAEAGDLEKLSRNLDKTRCEIVQALNILA
jgi:hypothetical protein